MSETEKNKVLNPTELKYNADGLIPAIVQDVNSKEVLMMAYMNIDSLQKTLETKLTWFWSRSRQCYWQKGESSGHIQEVVSVEHDCDADTLLIKVKQTGVACHTGHYTCFYNPMLTTAAAAEHSVSPAYLAEIEAVIKERQDKQPAGSYVAELLNKGEQEVARKLGEENLETMLAFLKGSDQELAAEAADLVFHLMVALQARNVPLAEVIKELMQRREGANRG